MSDQDVKQQIKVKYSLNQCIDDLLVHSLTSLVDPVAKIRAAIMLIEEYEEELEYEDGAKDPNLEITREKCEEISDGIENMANELIVKTRDYYGNGWGGAYENTEDMAKLYFKHYSAIIEKNRDK